MNPKVKIVFTLSLVLNVFLIGSIAGVAVERMGHGDRRMHAELSPASMEIVRNNIRASMKEARPAAMRASESRREMMRSISGAQIDEDAYNRAAGEMIRAHSDIMRLRAASTLDMALALPPGEREKFAAHLMSPERFSGRFGMTPERGGRHQSPR